MSSLALKSCSITDLFFLPKPTAGPLYDKKRISIMKELIGFSTDVSNDYQHAPPPLKPMYLRPDQAFKDYWFWKYGFVKLGRTPLPNKDSQI